MKRIFATVLILISLIALSACAKKIDYPFIRDTAEIERVSVVNVSVNENGELEEDIFAFFTDPEVIAEFVTDLRALECIAADEDDPAPLIADGARESVFKLKYKSGDIEYINYCGQASLIGDALDLNASAGTFAQLDFNNLLTKYIRKYTNQ